MQRRSLAVLAVAVPPAIVVVVAIVAPAFMPTPAFFRDDLQDAAAFKGHAVQHPALENTLFVRRLEAGQVVRDLAHQVAPPVAVHVDPALVAFDLGGSSKTPKPVGFSSGTVIANGSC